MKVFIIIGIWAGCLQDVQAFTDQEKARAQRKVMLKDYGLTDDDKPDNQHSPECRWNDENELHLHEVEMLRDGSSVVLRGDFERIRGGN